MRDIAISDMAGAVVTRWRVLPEGALLLTVRAGREEARLICRCSRSHWIVREAPEGEAPSLVAICHACRTRVEFVLEGPRAAPA